MFQWCHSGVTVVSGYCYSGVIVVLATPSDATQSATPGRCIKRWENMCTILKECCSVAVVYKAFVAPSSKYSLMRVGRNTLKVFVALQWCYNGVTMV
jgi:hypothetical protein